MKWNVSNSVVIFAFLAGSVGLGAGQAVTEQGSPMALVKPAAITQPEVQLLTSIHMATHGLDTNAGTLESPVATLPKAIALAEKQSVPCEIVVRGGTYDVTNTVVIRHCPKNKDRKLVIRSADNETAIFDGSIRIEKAEPLAGAPGVFTIKGNFPSDEPPPVWDEDSGRWFSKLASVESVKQQDDSCVVLDSQTLALRAHAGGSPMNRRLRMSRSGVSCGLMIYRDHVTVKGIEFRNFCLNNSSSAIRVGDTQVRITYDRKQELAPREGALTAHTVLDSCGASNCFKGFWIYAGGSNSVITRCRTRNTITGIWVSGIDATVENCVIVNDAVGFENTRAFEGESNGIRMYNGCNRATVRSNLITGFRIGIFCKNGWGDFFIENNTVLYGQSEFRGAVCAIRPNMKKDYHVRRNIFVGFAQPFGDAGDIPPDADIDENVFWGPEYDVTYTLNKFKAQGVGPHNVYADPCFASPHNGDYRLLPGSPALKAQDGAKIGAFPAVPADYRGAPNVRVTLAMERGALARDPFPPSAVPPFAAYVGSQRVLSANLAVSSMAPAKKTRFTINDGAGQEKDFKASDTFELPDRDGQHTLRFQVQDAHGEWSEESVAYVTLRRSGVQLIGEPRFVTSRYGALCSFKADRQAWGKLEYQAGGQWIEAANSKGLPKNWEGFEEDYGEYREFSLLPLLAAGLAPSTSYRYRLTVATPLDSTVKEGTFVLSGKPKILYVSTAGEDSEACGSRAQPFRTLQFALDRALPGDRVRLLPGVYVGASILNHGGTAEHPLVIEGLYPNTVILDGLGKVATALRLDHAPHVILRNLNVRWTTAMGVSVNNSEAVRITQCRFQNQYWETASWCLGQGILFWRSPNFLVDHCLFMGFHKAGLVSDESSGGQILHNTATACEVALIQWRSWWKPSENITIKYNSLNWNADQLLSIQQPLDTLRNKCVIDYNNYGTTFKREEGVILSGDRKYGKSLVKPFSYLPSNREFQYYRDTTDPSNEVTHVFGSLADWQTFSGQDKHSLFADPKWMDPKAGRFDVAADSPNLLPDGKIIGAQGFLGKTPNMEPEVVVTAPYSGEELKGAFTVAADTSDHDGAVRRVEFYAGTNLIGQAEAQPYQLTGVKLDEGTHVITARAIDDKGAMAVSDEVRITVSSLTAESHDKNKKI